MNKILVVDDEQQILSIIKSYFSSKSYFVIEANNSYDAMNKLSNKPNIILLDIMMPDLDGIEFCRKVRDKVSCPILFLSAKTETTSKVLGLAAGGDDYITKPFSMQELHARVEAHLRREKRINNISTLVWFDQLWIDYNRKECGVKNKALGFTKKEYAILELLSLNSKQVFSKESIYENIWGYDANGDAQTSVTEHIKRIRKKLYFYNMSEVIETVWGIGYRWKK